MSVSLPTGGFEAFSKLANESSAGRDLALKKPIVEDPFTEKKTRVQTP